MEPFINLPLNGIEESYPNHTQQLKVDPQCLKIFGLVQIIQKYFIATYVSTQHDGARSVALHAVADEEGLQHVEDGLEAVELGHLLLGLDLDLHAAGGAARAVEAAVGTEQNVGDLHRSSSQSIPSCIIYSSIATLPAPATISILCCTAERAL